MYFTSSKHSNLSDYCVLDLETTGLKPENCEIIEVGILKVRNGRPTEKMDVLIRPKQLPIPSAITGITHITTEMVLEAPCIEEVAYWIWDFIGNDVIVGYNIRFDLSFLQIHTHKHGQIPNACLDVLPLARKYWPQLPKHSLSAMTNYLHLYQNTHRALDDCIATWQLYEIAKKRF